MRKWGGLARLAIERRANGVHSPPVRIREALRKKKERRKEKGEEGRGKGDNGTALDEMMCKRRFLAINSCSALQCLLVNSHPRFRRNTSVKR